MRRSQPPIKLFVTIFHAVRQVSQPRWLVFLILLLSVPPAFADNGRAASHPAPRHNTPTAAGEGTWDDRFGYPGLGYGPLRAMTRHGDDLYVGGTFFHAGGVPAENVARWDGRRFHALGAGVNGEVEDIAASAGSVYVVGDFDTAGDATAGGIARWDGESWSAVGPTDAFLDAYGGPGALYAAAVGPDGELYVGGSFATVEGQPAHNLAVWDGDAWSPVGRGVGDLNYEETGVEYGTVYTIVVSGDDVYVGGTFSAAGNDEDFVRTANVARWDSRDETWSALGGGAGDQPYYPGEPIRGGAIRAIAVEGDTVYVGGQFDRAGDIDLPARNVAVWDGKAWAALGDGAGGEYHSVYALAVVDGALYAGGDFDAAGGQTVNRIARWAGGDWSEVGGGTESFVYRLLPDGSGGLYVGGDFETSGALLANNIARWSGEAWNALGQGPTYSSIPGTVYAVAVAPTGEVYAGGNFDRIGGKTVNNIAMWDGTEWQPLGSGLDNWVYAIAIDGDDVYVGGTFTKASDRSANHIARWNRETREWSALGSGVDGSVFALASDGDWLYAGGDFTGAGTTSVLDVARWDGTDWSGLGEEFELGYGRVNALAVSDDVVVVGGDFSTVVYEGREVPAQAIVLQDRASGEWRSLDDGIARVDGGFDYGGVVNAIGIAGDDVYAGGDFDKAGDVVTRGVARYNLDTGWSAIGGEGVGGTSAPLVKALVVDGNDVYAGGDFTSIGTVEANYVARWDAAAESWTPIGSGVFGESFPLVHALAGDGQDLYVGGDFTSAGDAPAASFSRWGQATTSNVPIGDLWRGLFNRICLLDFGSGRAAHPLIRLMCGD